jgi:hypothetical protein
MLWLWFVVVGLVGTVVGVAGYGLFGWLQEYRRRRQREKWFTEIRDLVDQLGFSDDIKELPGYEDDEDV